MNLLIYHAGLYAASVALQKLAGFVFFLWLAGTLPVHDYAAWGLLYALQTALAGFGVVGIGEAVVGLLKTNRSAELRMQLFASANHVFVLNLATSILLGLLLSAIYFKLADASLLATISALASGSLLAYSSLQSQILRLEEKHYSSLCFSFAVPLAGLIGSAMGFLLERTVESFFVGSTFGLALSMVSAKVNKVGFYSWTSSPAEWRPVFSRITPFIPVALLGWLGGYGNNYFIQFFFDAAEVARFTFVYILASTMQLLASGMNQVWSPRFYRVMHEYPLDLVERENLRFSRLQAIVLGLAGGVLVGVYPAAVSMLGGNLLLYQGMRLELSLLVLAYVVLIPWWHCSNYFLAYDEGPKIMRIYVTSSLLAMGILVLLMLTLGPLGIYVGFLVQTGLRAAGAFVVARKQWPVKVGLGGVVIGSVLVLTGLAITTGSGLVR